MRVLLILVLLVFIAKAFWRVVDGILEGSGLAGRVASPSVGRRSAQPAPGVQMARDPICGTFVIPSRAVVLDDGPQRVYFCSDRCRDRYRSRPV